jgi:uncharacterized protein (DUF1697 family)
VTGSYVALLRGVNVGGKNLLPMKELAVLCREVGCEDVRTYIQSGNVLFRARSGEAEEVAVRVRDEILARFGIRSPVVVRSAGEMRRVLQGNPFIAAGAPEDALYVLFLADEPSAERVASLDPKRSAVDAFAVVGREVYLHLPGGAANTKLTNAYFDGRLATVSTGRNWRTVKTLTEMLER